jgi:L-aspartate oxidase
VRVLNNTRANALLSRDGRCSGARFVADGGERSVSAEAVLLATGGAGQVFSETTNPPIATGDGIALAWRAGARVTDLEFVQFHPTALAVPGAPRFLLSEALRGEGARLVNADGERFMTRYEPAGELAARDLVSRAIVQEISRTNRPVFLTLQHLDPDWVHARFPTIAAACRAAGLDLAQDQIPVGPAAHYVMGGVETDLWARTSLPGLFAAGEVACTGVHGANRLASNSLLEGLVFGARGAKAMIEKPQAGEMFSKLAGGSEDLPQQVTAGRTVSDRDIQSLMWRSVGLARDAESLSRAIAALDAARERSTLAIVAWLMAKAALRREESRGGHYRSDFPARDDVHWRFHLSEQRHG